MNRKKRFPKRTNKQVLRRHQTRIKMMKPRTLRMMAPTRLMMGKSTQSTLVKGPMKEKGKK
jgi:hypothetical protein